jgi:transcriptional antiterminator NusG
MTKDDSSTALSDDLQNQQISFFTSKGKQDPSVGRNWYVIHTYSGYENAVKEALMQRIESLGMQNYIFNVIVPTEKIMIMKKGKLTEEERRIFPGYVLVDMTVTDESWYVVRNTPNVTGFVGSGTVPVAVSGDEFKILKRQMGQQEPIFKIDVDVGDRVIILKGPFAQYEGVVNAVDDEKGKIKVLISIFGRETPVELDFDQVKKK